MPTQVHVRVPATSADLGPGFDTLGLALHNELTLGESDHVMVSINGEGAGELAVDGDNLVVRAACSIPVDDAADRRGRRLLLICVYVVVEGRVVEKAAYTVWIPKARGKECMLGIRWMI